MICLWVVEMWVDGCRWEPTVGVRLTRDGGRDELFDWKTGNPSDRFRLVKYVRYRR